MKCFSIAIALLSLVVCGCLSSDAVDATSWTVDPVLDDTQTGVMASEGAGVPFFATTRLGLVSVDAPFDKIQFVVRREDGSVAFDHYNLFAAPPATLLRPSIRSRLCADNRFGSVVATSSAAGIDAQAEVQVLDLSLDCRNDGKRIARAAVRLDVVKMGNGPRIIALSGEGRGEYDAAGGDYTKAFSAAFDEAVMNALAHARTMQNGKSDK